MFDDDEISEARSQDVARGKKTAQSLKRREERFKRALLNALTSNDREVFSEILINDLGKPYGSEEYVNAMKVFDEQQK
jgi:hypothetical protein